MASIWQDTITGFVLSACSGAGLSPDKKSSALNSMDFPAPVSPVTMVSPGWILRDISGKSPKFFMLIFRIIVVCFPV